MPTRLIWHDYVVLSTDLALHFVLQRQRTTQKEEKRRRKEEEDGDEGGEMMRTSLPNCDLEKEKWEYEAVHDEALTCVCLEQASFVCVLGSRAVEEEEEENAICCVANFYFVTVWLHLVSEQQTASGLELQFWIHNPSIQWFT